MIQKVNSRRLPKTREMETTSREYRNTIWFPKKLPSNHWCVNGRTHTMHEDPTQQSETHQGTALDRFKFSSGHKI